MITIGCCTLSYTQAALVKINHGEMSYTGEMRTAVVKNKGI